MLRKWEDLPDFMRIPEVRPYWEVLWKRRFQLRIKRIFDFVIGILMFIILFIPMFVIAFAIMCEDGGSILYRQERVTTYGKRFRIHKFRTMVSDADKIGTAVTIVNDPRITKIGERLRKWRLDELPQLLDVINGNMTFVGTRPETPKYVESYRNEWFATLLIPAGITSECSIRFKDEDKLLNEAADIDEVYICRILPEKMQWNLDSLSKFGLYSDILTMIKTIKVVYKKGVK